MEKQIGCILLGKKDNYSLESHRLWININGEMKLSEPHMFCPYIQEYQDLYFTSDELIKKGWKGIAYKNNVKGKIFKHFYTENTWYNDAEIVVVSTDKSLGLPEPSIEWIQYYIQEYNKGNIITKVMVEYDYTLGNEEDERGNLIPVEIFKVNPDNTINIKSIKDSWTREEVIELLSQYGMWRLDNQTKNILKDGKQKFHERA